MEIEGNSTSISPDNTTDTETSYSSHEYFNLNWFLFLISLGTLVADIYVITIIRKYKSLQTYYNLLILKATWFHLGYIILGDILAIIVSLLSNGLKSEGFCFLRNLDFLCLGMVYFLMTVLAVDWFVAQYRPELHQKYFRTFKRGLCACYLMIMPEALVTSVYCYADEESIDLVRNIFKNVSFLLCLVVVVVMFILKRQRPLPLDSRKFEYSFKISCVFLLMCLPMNIDNFFRNYYHHVTDKTYQTVLVVLGDVAFAIFLMAPMVMMYMLSVSNKHFRVAYIRCCKNKKSKSYADENLDDEESGTGEQDNAVTYDKGFDSVQLAN
ncbi:hypothetical protein GWI33_007547 [Rhynchophorus ferrugineus]|uniref:G-protein coupled receptors family 1 profile domain-containing protein n=1 Tax=Rhynchophorus ferrugineus TaxID=354439 RepID=A0A834MCX1_RHYFE|nr:hypothetical protein GWI33_007547 [Rhynchophorus ferrugineus]